MALPPFEQVIAEHGSFVLRVTRAVLPLHDAEDAAADAFVSALEAYPRLRVDSDLKAWLATIAHRKALDAVRRRARQAVPVADVPEMNATPAEAAPDSRLWEAVRALPEKQREAVAYRYVADLAYAQVARAMGISEPAARRNAADGIRALRRHLQFADPLSPSATREELQR